MTVLPDTRKDACIGYHACISHAPGLPRPERRRNRGNRSRSPAGRAQSHIRIIRPAAALWRHPGDVLVRVFDVAGFAVDAILRVDHVAWLAALLDPFIDASRAIA